MGSSRASTASTSPSRRRCWRRPTCCSRCRYGDRAAVLRRTGRRSPGPGLDVGGPAAAGRRTRPGAGRSAAGGRCTRSTSRPVAYRGRCRPLVLGRRSAGESGASSPTGSTAAGAPFAASCCAAEVPVPARARGAPRAATRPADVPPRPVVRTTCSGRPPAVELCVIDWDNCGPADPSHELACAVYEFGQRDADRMRAFYDAYRAAGGPARLSARASSPC